MSEDPNARRVTKDVTEPKPHKVSDRRSTFGLDGIERAYEPPAESPTPPPGFDVAPPFRPGDKVQLVGTVVSVTHTQGAEFAVTVETESGPVGVRASALKHLKRPPEDKAVKHAPETK